MNTGFYNDTYIYVILIDIASNYPYMQYEIRKPLHYSYNQHSRIQQYIYDIDGLVQERCNSIA